MELAAMAGELGRMRSRPPATWALATRSWVAADRAAFSWPQSSRSRNNRSLLQAPPVHPGGAFLCSEFSAATDAAVREGADDIGTNYRAGVAVTVGFPVM